jgi:hypothetical protein
MNAVQELANKEMGGNILHPTMEKIYNQLSSIEKDKVEHYFLRVQSKSITFSPSSIVKLIQSPMKYFEQYVCGNFDDKETKSRVLGNLVHLMLSDPHLVAQDYYVAPENMSMDAGIVETLKYLASLDATSTDLLLYKQEALNHLKEIKYQTNWGDEAKWKRFENEEAKAFFLELMSNKHKKFISQALYDEASFKAMMIQSMNNSSRFTIVDPEAEDLVFEVELETVDPRTGLNLKCVIDVMKINVKEKKIFVTDFKTTSKTVEKWVKFEIENNLSWIQPAINVMVVKEFLKDKEEFKDFEIEFAFGLIDGNNSTQLIPVSDTTIQDWILRTQEVLETKVGYHLTEKDFRAPVSFLKNEVCL